MIAPETVDAAIRAAGEYLVRQCGESGQFDYRRNLDPRIAVRPRYNLVRHAGAMYALTCYHACTHDPRIKTAAGRATKFLCGNIAPISNSPQCLAVWSRPEVEGHRQETQCKLGATGLALVALAQVRSIEPRFVDAATLSGLAEFIVQMQKESGEFYSKYFPQRAERSDDWTSLYYPGEAALGLLAAYRCDANPRWRIAAGRALEFLARSRQGMFPVEADHWALLATAEYLQRKEVKEDGKSTQPLMEHAIAVCQSMLHEQLQCGGNAPGRGWFTADGRTTPTATRLEGLIAALRFLPDSSALRDPILRGVAEGIHFLLRSRVKTGAFAGAVPRVAPEVHSWPGGKAADPRAWEVRIDYVQHALCALIQWRQTAQPMLPPAASDAPTWPGVTQIDVGTTLAGQDNADPNGS